MRDIFFLSYNKICYTFQKHITKLEHFKITNFQLFFGSNSAVKTHYTSVKVKHKRQLQKTLGQITRLKRYKLSTLFQLSSLLEAGKFTEHQALNFNNIQCTIF